MKKWKTLLKSLKTPIERLEKYLIENNIVVDGFADELRGKARDACRDALKASSELPKPEIDSLFEDVYDVVPPHLEE